MRALVLCVLLAGLVGIGFLACNPNSIGRPCINPQGNKVAGTQIVSPALECPSRQCLIQPLSGSGGMSGATDGGIRATCTAFCSSNDDCSAETKAYCPQGFVCAVATTVDKFCCRKVCVCRSDLIAGFNSAYDGGAVMMPTACDPKLNPNSTCQNIGHPNG